MFRGINTTVFCICFLVPAWCSDLNFPQGFIFGAASSAYQAEGGWDADGKGESIWDHFTHTHPQANRSNADMSSNSYYLWRDDIAAAKQLGIKFYRFSISWTRILPSGMINNVNEDGLMYYNDLINELLTNNIQPIVCLYHNDLPYRIQQLGGWANPYVSDWFADYARIIFSSFGDRVKYWLTVNDPRQHCESLYTRAVGPGVFDPMYGKYLCDKHMLLAHAKAWRLYNKEFREMTYGMVSYSVSTVLYTGGDDLATLAWNYNARYMHPVYSRKGGWPVEIETLVANNSEREGYKRSRLPAFTQEEIELIRGTFDYFALEFNEVKMVRYIKPEEDLNWEFPNVIKEINAVCEEVKDSTTKSIALQKQLNFLKRQYGNIQFIITGDGFPTMGLNIEDYDRKLYLNENLEQALDAIHDGVMVKGYIVWSLFDNYDWFNGYTKLYGLYEINFEDSTLKRRPRESMFYYSSVIKQNSLEVADHTSQTTNIQCNWLIISLLCAIVQNVV